MTTQVGRETTNALDFGAVRHGDHPAEQRFTAGRFAAAQVAFATFGAHHDPRTRHAEPFRGCFVRFEFELFSQDKNSPGFCGPDDRSRQ